MKNKSRLLTIALIVAAFFGLHYFIYLDIAYNIPFIQSSTEMPAKMKAFTLCETKFPDYFNPFQKATYTYCLNEGSQKISEEAKSYFSYSDMQPLSEKLSKYWQGEEIEGKMFVRDLSVEDYPNPIFFLIQYSLLAAFIFLVVKIVKSK